MDHLSSQIDTFFMTIGKLIAFAIIFSPVIIYRHFKNKKDRANGIDPEEIARQVETQEKLKKEKEDYERYFKNQGY